MTDDRFVEALKERISEADRRLDPLVPGAPPLYEIESPAASYRRKQPASRGTAWRTQLSPGFGIVAAVVVVAALVFASSARTPAGPGGSGSPVATLHATNSPASSVPVHGRFSPTGAMVGGGRDGHTATLLPDGRVLVAGGLGLASAELYDPATGTFSATGSMSVARYRATATLLSDGRILVAGGQDGGADLASAELYDPATGRFTLTGSMAQARFYQTAALLPDGRVLVAGGLQGTDAAGLVSAEVFDPATGTFSPTGTMTSSSDGTAISLSNGRILIAGGTLLRQTEIYDPTTGKFSSLGEAKIGAAAVLLDGRVFIGGGWANNVVDLQARVYHPDTNDLGGSQSMAVLRSRYSATVLPDGRVLVAGGLDQYGAPLASTELYDLGVGAFGRGAPMTEARYGQTATPLRDGRVLIVGGRGAGPLASAELYNP